MHSWVRRGYRLIPLLHSTLWWEVGLASFIMIFYELPVDRISTIPMQALYRTREPCLWVWLQVEVLFLVH